MNDYKKWYQGTTQEAFDKFYESAFGWMPKLIHKIRRK